MSGPVWIVADTNVVVSALLWGGKPFQLLEMAVDGHVRLFTSETLLRELQMTLEKPKLARVLAASGRAALEFVADYRRLATLVLQIDAVPTASRDPDDDHVLACAVAARAQYVVTGDDDLLVLGSYEGISMVSVSDLLGVVT